MTVSFDATVEESRIVSLIAKRVNKELTGAFPPLSPRTISDIEMSLIVCHCNACPLDLQKLLHADRITLLHDIIGIKVHINTQTGKLEDFFLPVCAMKSPTTPETD